MIGNLFDEKYFSFTKDYIEDDVLVKDYSNIPTATGPVEVMMNAVVLKGNKYTGNLIGPNRSVTQVEAIPVFISEGEEYRENYNWFE